MDRLLSLFDALANVLATAQPLPGTETVPLAQALWRSLGVDVRCAGPWPATDRSAMDGFAVVTGAAGLAAGTELPVVGESLAGKPFAGQLAEGAAIRIMTGAVVPVGADAVVPVEATSGFVGGSVTVKDGVRRGANIRPRGSELAAGTVVLRRGDLIRPAEIGALAVLGHEQVQVVPQPKVAILSTGDEVVPLGATPADHQVRDSNAHALSAQVVAAGAVPRRLGIARDDVTDTERLLREGLADADVLLTIGGISEGTHDLVQDRLLALGVAKRFHGIALKPGKPTFFGTRTCDGRTQWVFGLPGNPASCFTVFDLLVRPLLARLLGRAEPEGEPRARVAGRPFLPTKRLQAVPARLVLDAECGVSGELLAPKTSGDPFSLLAANGYLLLPEGATPDATRAARLWFQGRALFPR